MDERAYEDKILYGRLLERCRKRGGEGYRWRTMPCPACVADLMRATGETLKKAPKAVERL